MVHDLKDKVVFITGAAGGVGAGVVRLLMEKGVKHVAVIDVDESSGVALQEELNAKYGADKVKFYSCDVTDEETFLGLMVDVKSKHGYIDVLINNAGIMNDSWQSYKKAILINVLALVTGSLRALEMMRRDEGGQGGTIINIASTVALCQMPYLPVYFGTKSAVLQFTNCLGMEGFHSRTGVRVIAVCYGVTQTALLTPQKAGSFDKKFDSELVDIMKDAKKQKMESAAMGVIEAFKHGESGSTWVATRDEPCKDITADIKKVHDLLAAHASYDGMK